MAWKWRVCEASWLARRGRECLAHINFCVN
ncbi:hypothetical protein CBM2615_A70054 [Cupriavidus taiwanensis]|uniref:Uncharacterized protein n=1 Tax=Cupriavidus taiwanensis TaxID=164546 RepID=A0A375E3V7_9BURK|nr:hypothetical protein CBM2615_A70054 [Cupriavidus taiwanensis]SOZ60365.1 hypothetical protein CBM2614_A60182 [Cupriavidus taiwanensis]SOZ63960.1 hypothetical protein CBM2613_A50184 [Cupriavidus taiwanensis]SPA06646.1 hypothetical protein CBM2625_A60151 [Cupriavidus taiwanensis]